MARFTVRLPERTLDRLDALARERGLTRAGLVRRLVDRAVEGKAIPEDVAQPTEDELLALLAEKARSGNVAAIRTLLAREEQADPRARALAALEQMATDRRQ